MLILNKSNFEYGTFTCSTVVLLLLLTDLSTFIIGASQTQLDQNSLNTNPHFLYARCILISYGEKTPSRSSVCKAIADQHCQTAR